VRASGGHYISAASTLEIAFASFELRELCEHEEVALQRVGVFATEALKNRLSDLRSADSVKEVLAGDPREVTRHGISYYMIDLADGYELSICSNYIKERRAVGGQVDWLRVRRVKVIAVEKSHE
jgi:hypothetical protein